MRRLIAVMLFVSALCVLTVEALSAKDLTVTLQPGQSATIPMKFWCLDFGKSFPQNVSGPTQRAPDNVYKVLQAAIARGTINSDPYQTQLAIYEATTGQVNDQANEGHAVADQIVNDAKNGNVQPVPQGVTTLDQALANGSVKVDVQNFHAISDTKHPNLQPYMGTGDLVVQNTSDKAVTFLLVEGAVFKPAGGANAQSTAGTTEQTLISHQDTSRPSALPTTGGVRNGSAMPVLSLLALVGGALCLMLARRLKVTQPG